MSPSKSSNVVNDKKSKAIANESLGGSAQLKAREYNLSPATATEAKQKEDPPIEIKNVLEGEAWMDYRRTKVRKKTFLFIPYGDETYHPECAEHSRDQVETGDGADHYSPTGGKSRIDMYVDDRQKDKSKLNFSLGVNTVIENLQKGRAVMAGVMYNPDKNTGNYNKATNHFITIVGMGEDETGIYFSYYDNYSDGQGEKIGTDLEENRLYYNMDSSNPMFKDVTNVPLDAGKKDRTATYTLTEVRNNVDD